MLRKMLSKQTRGPSKGLVNTITDEQRIANFNYISSLINPYEAAITRTQAALPTVIPIPTTSMHLIEKATLTCQSTGTFRLMWTMPKTLEKNPASGYLQRNTFVSTDGFWYPMGGAPGTIEMNYPLSSANKVRLVSAELRITYIGTVLDRAGYIHSATSFNKGYTKYSIVTAPGNGGATEPDWQSLQQAPWYISEAVSDKVHHCLWVPTDYNDMNFYEVKDVQGSTADYLPPCHDVQWNIQVNGAKSGSPFLVEIASNWEVQLPSDQDIYARTNVRPNINIQAAEELRNNVASRNPKIDSNVSQALNANNKTLEAIAEAMAVESPQEAKNRLIDMVEYATGGKINPNDYLGGKQNFKEPPTASDVFGYMFGGPSGHF